MSFSHISYLIGLFSSFKHSSDLLWIPCLWVQILTQGWCNQSYIICWIDPLLMGSIDLADFTGVSHARPIDFSFRGSMARYVLVISHVLLVYSPDWDLVQTCIIDPLHMGSKHATKPISYVLPSHVINYWSRVVAKLILIYFYYRFLCTPGWTYLK